MPDGFIENVRSITGPAAVHIPKCVRERACAAFADGLEGMLDNDASWSVLLEAFTTLVFFGLPYGTSEVIEFEQRISHWERGELVELLNRIRLQSEAKQKDIQRLSELDAATQAGRRARRLAQEGARSRAFEAASNA
jgi:hypothetical protein